MGEKNAILWYVVASPLRVRVRDYCLHMCFGPWSEWKCQLELKKELLFSTVMSFTVGGGIDCRLLLLVSYFRLIFKQPIESLITGAVWEQCAKARKFIKYDEKFMGVARPWISPGESQMDSQKSIAASIRGSYVVMQFFCTVWIITDLTHVRLEERNSTVFLRKWISLNSHRLCPSSRSCWCLRWIYCRSNYCWVAHLWSHHKLFVLNYFFTLLQLIQFHKFHFLGNLSTLRNFLLDYFDWKLFDLEQWTLSCRVHLISPPKHAKLLK